MTGSSRLDAFTVGDGALEVEFWSDPAYESGSARNAHRYGREIVVGAHQRRATGVEVRVDGVPVASAVLLCDAGCPAVSSTSTALRGGTLYVSMQDHVAALSLPSLDTRWMTDVDDACVFGFVEVAGMDALLVHGELCISRLGLDGRIQWQQGGADIFTGGCWMADGVVVAADWNGTEYRWRWSDGEALGVTPGAHPPTGATVHAPDER
ncbi:MAG TPA: hypothetical protein VE871_04200 [Longimicrobium sp.]|nr:hypothetical protein [Longimicrobium sp.]